MSLPSPLPRASVPLLAMSQCASGRRRWPESERKQVGGDILAAALRVGACALCEGSKDSAVLVELPPGVYTVSVESAGPVTTSGDVLVEVYRVPELD